MFNQYDIVELTRDLNPAIRAGMVGTILEVWSDDAFEVEFVDEDGFNHDYNGEATFTVTTKDIKPLRRVEQ